MKNSNAFNYKDWLKSKEVSEEIKEQIKKLSPPQLRQAFCNKQLVFGTAGIRQIMGPGTQMLNKFVYEQMAIGYAKYINIKYKKVNEKTIIIGHDNRKNSDYFALVCANKIRQYGINVLLFEDNQLMPTPIISYAIRRLKTQGAINITASHNPKEYNGFKAYNASGAQILDDEAKIIVDNMPKSKDILNLPQLPLTGQLNYIPTKQLIDEYFCDLKNVIVNKEWINAKKTIPIVFTAHHGTTCNLMPQFLKFLNFTNVHCVKQQCFVDSNFTNSPISNPEDPKSFDAAIKLANKVKSDIVFACDPDGDRMAIGFRKLDRWRFMSGNEMGIVFAYYVLDKCRFKKQPYILSTWVSTNYIDYIANEFKAKVIRTKTGFKWMCNMLDKLEKSGNFVVGFEEAIGALNSTINRDKDGFGAIALALEIYYDVSKYYSNLHNYLIRFIYHKYGDHLCKTTSYTINVDDWKKAAQTIMKNVLAFNQTKLEAYKVKKVCFNDQSDCVEWILNNNSWVKFRISGTEPKLKVYCCLNEFTAAQLSSMFARIKSMIEENYLSKYTS